MWANTRSSRGRFSRDLHVSRRNAPTTKNVIRAHERVRNFLAYVESLAGRIEVKKFFIYLDDTIVFAKGVKTH